MSRKEHERGIIDDGEWAYDNRDEIPDDAVPKERCENCDHYRYSEIDDEWVCMCQYSDYYGEPMGDNDYCDEWGKAK